LIKGLKLEIDGTEIIIPMDRAKELYDDLDILFGTKNNVTYTNPFNTEWVNPISYGDTTFSAGELPENRR